MNRFRVVPKRHTPKGPKMPVVLIWPGFGAEKNSRKTIGGWGKTPHLSARPLCPPKHPPSRSSGVGPQTRAEQKAGHSTFFLRFSQIICAIAHWGGGNACLSEIQPEFKPRNGGGRGKQTKPNQKSECGAPATPQFKNPHSIPSLFKDPPKGIKMAP